MKKMLAMLLAAFMMVSAVACTADVDDSLSAVELDKTDVDDTFVGETGEFKYEYIEGDTIRITKYNPKNEMHDLVIPSVMNGNTVVEIGEEAFANISSVSSVAIPATVTKIGEEAFANCDRMVSVTIPASLTAMGTAVFYNCDLLETVNFTGEEKLTAIGDSAFHMCVALRSIDLPDTVAEIGMGAFMGCAALETVDLSKTAMTKIGDYAFMNCKKLASVTFSANLSSCGAYAFGNCVDTAVSFGDATGWKAVDTENGAEIDVDVSTGEKAYDVLIDEYFQYVLVK